MLQNVSKIRYRFNYLSTYINVKADDQNLSNLQYYNVSIDNFPQKQNFIFKTSGNIYNHQPTTGQALYGGPAAKDYEFYLMNNEI